jgi:sn-glycerol 3-phosphate transport system substrate-binding protein
VVKQFNTAQQDVQVGYQLQGAYADLANKLTAAVQANQAPDVPLLSDVWWFKFYLNRTLVPLDDLMKAQKIDPKDYVDSLFTEGVRVRASSGSSAASTQTPSSPSRSRSRTGSRPASSSARR